jgi:hypothetical protein
MRAFLFGTALVLSWCTYSTAQIDEILRKAGDALSHQNAASLSDSKITAGLKQALEISTGKAVSLTGRPDGFFRNQAIKILLPPKLQTVGRGMRMLGMGAKVDEREVGMNRAAEQAAPDR